MVKLRRRRPRAGFTLIELLVAISILAIIAVLGWRGLDSIVRTRSALNQDLEQTRGLQITFAQLQSDCEHAAVSYDLGGRAVLAIEPQRLNLVRTVQTDNQPTSLQVIAYRIKDGVLLRSESITTRDLRQLELIWRATLADTDPVVPVKLQQGVSGLAMQTWFSDGNWRATNGEIIINPTQNAPGTGPNQPSVNPTGLQVALQLQGVDGSLTKNFMLGAI